MILKYHLFFLNNIKRLTKNIKTKILKQLFYDNQLKRKNEISNLQALYLICYTVYICLKTI